MNQILPTIAVVGAGAIGSYFGGMLARAGMNVTLIGRKPHVDAIRRNGLTFQSRDLEERIAIAATDDIAGVRDARLILFCVKCLDTETAAQQMAPHLPPDAVILSLQNGVDNAERIGRHLGNEVVPALVYAAANLPRPGHVKHTGGGNLVMGQLPGSRAERPSRGLSLGEITKLFSDASVPVRISDTIEVELWTKLTMNCAYNAVSALGGARYAQMVANAEIRRIMQDAVTEVVEVAGAKGVHLPDSILADTMRLADAMPQTLSSTAQDIAAGRRTEIDHLNGYVVREGEALGIATPVNRTLNALIKLVEQVKVAQPAEKP
jgi:2-dehydropantoate 2-reductase